MLGKNCGGRFPFGSPFRFRISLSQDYLDWRDADWHGDGAFDEVSQVISVIIPTLNEERTLPNLLSQFPEELIRRYDIELIISDGGSTDQTTQIAGKLAHRVLTSTPSKQHTIGGLRNIGGRKSSGEILFFFNADIMVENIDRFFELMLEAHATPNVVATTCPVYVNPEEENLFDRLFHVFFSLHVWLLNLLGFGTGRGECQVVKRDAFFSCGGYEENYPAGEDFDLFRRLAKKGKIRFLWPLKVYESPRRYRQVGYLRVTALWLINGIWIILFGRSFSSQWKVVR